MNYFINRNTFLYSLHKITFLHLIIDPILVTYLYDLGLSVSVIFLVNTISSIMCLFLEVPTGTWADLHGPKASIILSVTCYILANIFFVLGVYSQWSIIIGAIFSGLFQSFFSGADISYLFIALKASGKSESFTKINGKLDAAGYFVSAVISLSIGFLYHANPHLPFYLAIILSLVSLVPLLLADNLKDKIIQKESPNMGMGIMKASFGLIKASNTLKWFLIYTFIMTLSLAGITSTYQIYFKEIKIDSSYLGIIYTLFYLTSSISSNMAHRIQKFNYMKILLLFLVFLLVTILGMSFMDSKLILITLIPRIVIGFYPSIIHQYMNNEITENRNTILSIREFVKNIPQIVILPLIGFVIDQYHVSNGYFLLSLLIVVFLVVLMYLTRIIARKNRL